jgi:hypothetical protein
MLEVYLELARSLRLKLPDTVWNLLGLMLHELTLLGCHYIWILARLEVCRRFRQTPRGFGVTNNQRVLHHVHWLLLGRFNLDEADLSAQVQDQTRILLSDSFRPHNMIAYIYHPPISTYHPLSRSYWVVFLPLWYLLRAQWSVDAQDGSLGNTLRWDHDPLWLAAC